MDKEPPAHINIEKRTSEFVYKGITMRMTEVFGDPNPAHTRWGMLHPIVRLGHGST